MTLVVSNPINFFNAWLKDAIQAQSGDSVLTFMNALNRHALAHDASQDYIMPESRYQEQPGKFRIFGENQGCFYCFVHEGDQNKSDPPVLFESCLDLKLDYGFKNEEIINGHYVIVCPHFSAFIWHMLGHLICVRRKGNGLFKSGVNGIHFKGPVELDHRFINPLNREFPASHTCFFSQDIICDPDWGASFLNAQAYESFITEIRPKIDEYWT